MVSAGTGIWLPDSLELDHAPLSAERQEIYDNVNSLIPQDFQDRVTVVCGQKNVVVIGCPVGTSAADSYCDNTTRMKLYNACNLMLPSSPYVETIKVGRDIALTHVVAIVGNIHAPEKTIKGNVFVPVGTTVYSLRPLATPSKEQKHMQRALGHVVMPSPSVTNTSLCKLRNGMMAHTVTVANQFPAYYLPPVTDHLSIVSASGDNLAEKVSMTTEESYNTMAAKFFPTGYTIETEERDEVKEYGEFRRMVPGVKPSNALYYVTDETGRTVYDEKAYLCPAPIYSNNFEEQVKHSNGTIYNPVLHRLVADPNTAAQAKLFYDEGIIPGNIYDGTVFTTQDDELFYCFLDAGVAFAVPADAEGDVCRVIPCDVSDAQVREQYRSTWYRFLSPMTMEPFNGGISGKTKFRKATPIGGNGWYFVNAVVKHTGLANFVEYQGIRPPPANLNVGDIVYATKNESDDAVLSVSAFISGTTFFEGKQPATFSVTDANNNPFLGRRADLSSDGGNEANLTLAGDGEQWLENIKSKLDKYTSDYETANASDSTDTSLGPIAWEDMKNNDIVPSPNLNSSYTGEDIDVYDIKDMFGAEPRFYSKLARRVINRVEKHVLSQSPDAVPHSVGKLVASPAGATFDINARSANYGDVFAGAEAVVRCLAYSGVTLEQAAVQQSVYGSKQVVTDLNPLYQLLMLEGDNAGVNPSFALLMAMGPVCIEMFLKRAIQKVDYLNEAWYQESTRMDINMTSLQKWQNFAPEVVGIALRHNNQDIVAKLYENAINLNANAQRASAAAHALADRLVERLRTKRYVDRRTALLAVKFAYYERSAQRLQTAEAPHSYHPTVFKHLAEAAREYQFYGSVVQMPPPQGNKVLSNHRLLPRDTMPYVGTGSILPSRVVAGAELAVFAHIEKNFFSRPWSKRIAESIHLYTADAAAVAEVNKKNFRVIYGLEKTDLVEGEQLCESVEGYLPAKKPPSGVNAEIRRFKVFNRKRDPVTVKVDGKLKCYPPGTMTTIVRGGNSETTIVGHDHDVCVDGSLVLAFGAPGKYGALNFFDKARQSLYMGLVCRVFDHAKKNGFKTDYVGTAGDQIVEYTLKDNRWTLKDAKKEMYDTYFHFFRAARAPVIKIGEDNKKFDLAIASQFRDMLGDDADAFTDEELLLGYAAVQNKNKPATMVQFASGAPANGITAVFSDDRVTFTYPGETKTLKVANLASAVLANADFA